MSDFTLTPEQRDLLRRTMLAEGSDDDAIEFFTTCERLGLDPFADQILATFRKDSRTGSKRMAVQVQIHGLRCLADRTGCYAPGSATQYEYNDKGQLVAATVYVRKWARGQWHEYSETALWSEYGDTRNAWASHPHVMLAKCAEALALRRGFPERMGGLYEPAEMGDGTAPDVATPTDASEAPASNGSRPKSDPAVVRSLIGRYDHALTKADLQAVRSDHEAAVAERQLVAGGDSVPAVEAAVERAQVRVMTLADLARGYQQARDRESFEAVERLQQAALEGGVLPAGSEGYAGAEARRLKCLASLVATQEDIDQLGDAVRRSLEAGHLPSSGPLYEAVTRALTEAAEEREMHDAESSVGIEG